MLVWLSMVAAIAASNITFPPFNGNPFERFSISTDGINATFMPYGARLTNLFVNDKTGAARDVVMGYDSGDQYLLDSETIHSYMGAVVGRYANRISFGTFEIDGNVYHVPENKGNSTLHGGWVGYDQRNWTVVSHSEDSITFVFYDASFQGFPGDLINFATYTVSPGPRWTSRLVSIPLNKATPVMLSNHIYWNVGAFVNSRAQTVLDNTLYLPYSQRYVQVAIDQVPNGTVGTVAGTFLDFTTPTRIGSQINEAVGNCGINCTGYNNAYIIDRPRNSDPEATDITVLSMSSPDTGIQLDVRTNKQSLEIFSCNWFNGTIRGKSDQQYGTNRTYYELHGCIVIEPQGWIDAINNPQFGQDQYQIYSPTTEPAVNYATYDFSIVD